MDFGMVLNLIIMACGVYMIYWAVQMKSTKKIPEMLVGKGFPLSRARDPEGFIRFTFPFTFTTGVVLLAIGGVGALEIYILLPILDIVLKVILVIIIIGYGMLLMKAQRKYLL